MSGGVEKILASPLWRHAATLLVVGIAWGSLQTQVAYTQEKQDEFTAQQKEFVRVIDELRGVLTSIRVSGATTVQQVIAIEKQVDGISRKLDTLMWRTSPRNPNNREEGQR